MTTWLQVLPPSERQLIGRAGGFACQAKHGADGADAPAARAFAGRCAKLLREIDPDGALPPDVRQRLLRFAIKQEMALRAQQSAQKRREAKAARAGVPVACAWGGHVRSGTTSTICRRHKRDVERANWRRHLPDPA